MKQSIFKIIIFLIVLLLSLFTGSIIKKYDVLKLDDNNHIEMQCNGCIDKVHTSIALPHIDLKTSELAICLIAADADRAHDFYVECLGMEDKGEIQNPPANMHMYMFGYGEATLKVRVYDTDPPGRNTSLLAENGIKLVTIPVSDFDSAIIKLAEHGFTDPTIQIIDGVRTGMLADDDGNIVEILDATTAPMRNMEIGLIVPNVSEAQDFYTNILGLPEAPIIEGPAPLMNVTEYRYLANKTVVRFYSPPGTRPIPNDGVADILGFRYITFPLIKDVDITYDNMVNAGVTVVVPLTRYNLNTWLFMMRGPGGEILEFVGPKHKKSINLIDNVTLKNNCILQKKIGLAYSKIFDNKIIDIYLNNKNFIDMVFVQDYYAPKEPTGSPLSETLEALSLEPHRGRLFCSTSYVGPGGTRLDSFPNSNPKILVKDTAASSWRIDYEAGNLYARIAILKSVNFTTDGLGNPLPEPVPILVAGTGQWRSWFDQNDPDRYGVYVLSRDDNSNQWVKHKLYNNPWNPEMLNHANEVRMIFDHVDRVNGVHYVFAGSQSGRLFKGWYNASAPGFITWDTQPEIDGLPGNVLCAAEANDVQYIGIAFGSNGDNPPPPTRPIKDYGLWRRIDGDHDPVGPTSPPTTDPQWEWIYVEEWENSTVPGQSLYRGQIRGLCAIPDPKGGGYEVLGLHWDGPDCFLQIVDPINYYKVTEELDSRAFFKNEWGNSSYVITLGYNDWLPVTLSDTGEQVHFIGAWAQYPGGEFFGSEEGKSSWFLIRYADATYSIMRIWDSNNPIKSDIYSKDYDRNPAEPLIDKTYGLRGCRSIRPSPFPDEIGRVWYFCGFDLTGIGGQDVTGSHGWIYKGVINRAPNIPEIIGPTSDKPATIYEFKFLSSDLDDDNIYFNIDWGDMTNSGWIGPFSSGEEITINHTWSTRGRYTIQAKTKDVYGVESSWSTLQINMIKSIDLRHSWYNILKEIMSDFYMRNFNLKNFINY